MTDCGSSQIMILNVKNGAHSSIIFELAVLSTEKEEHHHHDHGNDNNEQHEHEHDDHSHGDDDGLG